MKQWHKIQESYQCVWCDFGSRGIFEGCKPHWPCPVHSRRHWPLQGAVGYMENSVPIESTCYCMIHRRPSVGLLHKPVPQFLSESTYEVCVTASDSCRCPLPSPPPTTAFTQFVPCHPHREQCCSAHLQDPWAEHSSNLGSSRLVKKFKDSALSSPLLFCLRETVPALESSLGSSALCQ